ncbi:MAG: hypothetical protein K2W92_04575 [Alphaproteobacteria bacterium]|nr:hypothetical protein [Alphaproteobacteria bacterium]
MNMIWGMISSGSAQQHKIALGFSGPAKQDLVCARVRSFLTIWMRIDPKRRRNVHVFNPNEWEPLDSKKDGHEMYRGKPS